MTAKKAAKGKKPPVKKVAVVYDKKLRSALLQTTAASTKQLQQQNRLKLKIDAKRKAYLHCCNNLGLTDEQLLEMDTDTDAQRIRKAENANKQKRAKRDK